MGIQCRVVPTISRFMLIAISPQFSLCKFMVSKTFILNLLDLMLLQLLIYFFIEV